jgi:hypothetical protein
MILSDVIVILNQNLGIISLVFAGVVAISTIIYALLTWKLVNETSKLREFQTEPRIFGHGPAYTIAFEIFPDFKYF